MRSQTALFSIGVALCSALATPVAFATPVPLMPGGTVTFAPTSSAFSGTEVDSLSTPFSNKFENGTIFEDVYLYDGTLDFYYEVTNNSASKDSLSRVTVGDFTGFTTSVDYLLNGGDAPTDATRQDAGDSVGFDFTLKIKPNTSTDWVEVVTNATTYDSDGTISVLDSVPVSISGLEPATTPEPATFALLGAGVLALVVVARRKFLTP